jgi:hypothetical protein
VIRAKHYNPFTHNCQKIWTNELLPIIVCQCPDRKPLETPSEVMDFVEILWTLLAVANLAVALINVLLGSAGLPFPLRLCSTSSKWGFVYVEIQKYIMLASFMQGNVYLTNSKVLIPYLDDDSLQRFEAGKNGDEFYDLYFDRIIEEVEKVLYEPNTLRLYTQFSSKIVSLFRFFIIFTPLSTGISLMYRFSPCALFLGIYILSVVLVTFQAWRAWRLVDLPQFPTLRSCEAQDFKIDLERKIN